MPRTESINPAPATNERKSRSRNAFTTGAILTGAFLIATYGLVRGTANEERRHSTLTADAEAKIPGFEAIPGDVSPLGLFSDIGNIAIELEDGSMCDIQYTAFGDGFEGAVFPDQARIVSYGTCPQPAEQ